MARIIIIALPVAAGLWYTYRSRSPFTGIERTFSTAPTQDSSFAAHIINPRARPATREIFTYRLPIHHLKECVSEEEILARWCRGFFGGWTFTPERIFFKITGIAWTKFSGKFYVRSCHPYLKSCDINADILAQHLTRRTSCLHQSGIHPNYHEKRCQT